MSNPTDSSSLTPEQAAAMQAALTAAIAEITRIGNINKMYFAAIFGITVWDWLVQLNSEWHLIWKSPNTYIKYSYILCRYWNFGVNVLAMVSFHGLFHEDTCDTMIKALSGVSAVTIASCANLLYIRTRAVWSKNNWVTDLLGILVIVEFVVLVSVGQTRSSIVPILPPGAKGNCFPQAKSRVSILYWLAPFVFDSTATILILIKTWETFRLGSSLAKVLVRDGVYYFLIISSFNLLNLGFWAQSDTKYQGINSTLALSLSSVLACRMVLSLKAKDGPVTGVKNTDSPSFVQGKLSNKVNTTAPTYIAFQSRGRNPPYDQGEDVLNEKLPSNVSETGLVNAVRLRSVPV